MSLLGRLAWVTPTSLLSWPIPCSVAKEAAFTRYAIEVYNNKLIYIYLQAGRANIAKCVASLVSHSAREAVVVVQQFMASLSATQQDYSLNYSNRNIYQFLPIQLLADDVLNEKIICSF